MEDPRTLYRENIGFCECGHPHLVHRFIIDCLSQLSPTFGDVPEGGGVDGIKRVIRDNPAAAAEFVLHFLDSRGLTDHGGSVFGSWQQPHAEGFIKAGPMPS